MQESYEAIVIGAGIVGLSVGFHLSERGVKTLILERGTFASGATGRSSGLVRMHYDLEAEAALAWLSFQYFRGWAERVGGECGFVRTGFLYIDQPLQDAALTSNVKMHQRLGIPTSVMTADDVHRMVPAFRTEDFTLAAYEPGSGYADPALTAGAFLNAARRQGAAYVGDCEVTGILASGGRIKGVQTQRGEFAAPVVVISAGPWSTRVARMAQIELPITTWTHDVGHIRRPNEIGPHPAVIDGALSMYFRPDAGGLTLAALEDNNRLGEDADADARYVAPDFVARLIDRLCLRVPGMSAGSLHSTHVGRDGLTPDQHAILSPAGPDGLHIAAGFSGTGFKTAPAVGLCMAEMVLSGRATSVDISGFSLDRFERGQHLQGPHPYGKIWH